MTTEIRGTSTGAFYDRATLSIGGLRQRAEDLQQQIGKGERLSRSSDDPVAASRLRVLYCRLLSDRRAFSLPASDPSFSPLLRFDAEHAARASPQIIASVKDAGVNA